MIKKKQECVESQYGVYFRARYLIYKSLPIGSAFEYMKKQLRFHCRLFVTPAFDVNKTRRPSCARAREGRVICCYNINVI